jgi:3',5'-cyclic AMP phosphodiesterase CpdA
MQPPILPGRLLHISDLHLGPVGFNHNEQALQNFLLYVPQLHRERRIDLVVASGDFCFDGELSSLSRAHGFLCDLTRELGLDPEIDLVVVPGNHDTARFRKFRWSERWARSEFLKQFKPYFRENAWQYFAEHNLAIYSFDSNRVPLLERLFSVNLPQLIAGGRIGRDALWRLDTTHKSLAERATNAPATFADSQYDNCFKVAVLHHHLVPIPSTSDKVLSVLPDSGDLLGGLVRCGFDLVLHGHKHVPFLARVAYEHFLTDNRSDTDILIAGAGSLSAKDVSTDSPNHFWIVDFDARSGSKTMLAIGGHAYLRGQWQPLGAAKHRTLERHEREPLMFTEDTVKFVERSIGYLRESAELYLSVNADGGGTQRIRHRIRSTISRLNRLHFRFRGEGDPIRVSGFQELGTPHRVVPGAPEIDEKGYIYIEFDPPLAESTIVEYELTVAFAAGFFARSTVDLDARRSGDTARSHIPKKIWNREYLSYVTSVPTQKLHLELQFQDGRDHEPDLHAFLGEPGDELRAQTKRLFEKRTDHGGNQYSVNLPKPTFGVKYYWSWIP